MEQLERRLEAMEEMLDRPWREEPATREKPRSRGTPEQRAYWRAKREAELAFCDASALTHDERLAFYYAWTHFAWLAGDHWHTYIVSAPALGA